MTLIFNKKSWHYRLILWTFGENFFMDTDIDWKAFQNLDSTVLDTLSYEAMPRKNTPKTVNLCPYCRALVGAIITAPFGYLYRLFPHKETHTPMTREQIRKNSKRRTWLSLGIGGGINLSIGFWNIFNSDISGLIQIGIGAALLTSLYWGEYFMKAIIKLSALVPKRKRVKKIKEPNPPKQHKTLAKIAAKHDVICPPIFFVDIQEPESLR